LTQVVRGLVIDASGRPVDGAAVVIVDGPGAWPDIACLTGDDGRFVLGTPSAGQYKLGVRSDEHGYVEAPIAVEHGTNEVTIEVGPQPESNEEEEEEEETP